MFNIDIKYIYIMFRKVKNMRVAVIGSRNLEIEDIGKYTPPKTTEIVSGGARGIDTVAKNYAIKNNIKLVEFKPDYRRYGKGAPLKRNLQIIAYADIVIAIWDGKSKGTKYVIDNCEKNKLKVIIV